MASATKLDVSRSVDLYEEAVRLMPGGSQTKGKRPNPASYGAMPIFMSHGKGSRLWDVNGNSYIDYYGASGGVLLGYCYPEVDRAVAEQLEKGMLFSTPSEPEIECAKLVNEVVPCSEMVRFLKGGVDVNLCATRIARAYTKREIILNNGYRGWADEWNYWRNDGGMPAAFHALNQQFRFNDLDHLEELFALNDGKVAAVSFDCAEPSKEPEPGFLQDLKDLAHRNGALVIYDECMTGFRFALGGAQEYYGVEPDIATYAKGMANGMSLGAVAGRRDIMEKTADCLISLTFGGETLSLAASIATLQICRDEDVAGHINRISRAVMDGVEEVSHRVGIPMESFGPPALFGIRFIGDSDQPLPADAGTFFYTGLAKRGVMLKGSWNNVLYAHSDEDVAETLEAVEDTLLDLRRARDAGRVSDEVAAATIPFNRPY